MLHKLWVWDRKYNMSEFIWPIHSLPLLPWFLVFTIKNDGIDVGRYIGHFSSIVVQEPPKVTSWETNQFHILYHILYIINIFHEIEFKVVWKQVIASYIWKYSHASRLYHFKWKAVACNSSNLFTAFNKKYISQHKSINTNLLYHIKWWRWRIYCSSNVFISSQNDFVVSI